MLWLLAIFDAKREDKYSFNNLFSMPTKYTLATLEEDQEVNFSIVLLVQNSYLALNQERDW